MDRLLIAALLLTMPLLAACDAQGACAHSYGTPDVSFVCRGGTYKVECRGPDPARPTVPPYTCTCTDPQGATRTFTRATEIWTYTHGSTDFSSGYQVVNEGCGWHLSH